MPRRVLPLTDKIFLTSLAIANICWTLAAFMGVAFVEWRWRAISR